jgi:hypothetical protein
MSKHPGIPGATPGEPNCGVQFHVNLHPGAFHCTRPPYHKGPHYDGYRGYWWGFTEAEEDHVTKQVWDYRRNAETAKAAKESKRRKNRKRWLKTW